MSETINADSRLCHRCVGEKTFKSTIKKIGTMADCSFCRKRVKTISLGQAAEIFDKVFEQNFVRTEDEPTGMEYTMSKESDYQWERSGEDIVELLQEVGHIEPEVAESIRQLLEDKHFDFDEAAMGEEGDFAPDSRYTDRKVESDEFHSEWRSFEESLKTKSRYFSKRATLTLLTLFNGIHRSTTVGNRPVSGQGSLWIKTDGGNGGAGGVGGRGQQGGGPKTGGVFGIGNCGGAVGGPGGDGGSGGAGGHVAKATFVYAAGATPVLIVTGVAATCGASQRPPAVQGATGKIVVWGATGCPGARGPNGQGGQGG